jgi:RNA recognition motif-containing protein
VQNIVLNKRGFAFIDCNDQVALDKAIEKLSGLKINGKEISVEHSGKLTKNVNFGSVNFWSICFFAT